MRKSEIPTFILRTDKMKKILEGFAYGILGAIIVMMIGGGILGIIYIAIWLFEKSSWLCAIFVLGAIGFVVGVGSYFDLDEKEGKKTER